MSGLYCAVEYRLNRVIVSSDDVEDGVHISVETPIGSVLGELRVPLPSNLFASVVNAVAFPSVSALLAEGKRISESNSAGGGS